MGIFHFGKKSSHTSASCTNDSKKTDQCDNSTFATIHRKELTACLNDAHVCKLLKIDSIFTATDIRVPKLSKEDYLRVMSYVFTVILVVSNAEKSYTAKFDREYKDIVNRYIDSDTKNEKVKAHIQQFFSMAEIVSHFEAAMESTSKVTDIAMTEFNKDGGKREIKDFIEFANSQLDKSLSVMMMTNAFSGIYYSK